MKIRLAQVEDTPAMARVIVDTFLSSNRGLMSEAAWQRRKTEWTYEVSAKGWRKLIEEIAAGIETQSCVYVAEDESGAVVGLAYGCPGKPPATASDVGEVDVLYVAESHQQQGYGRALTQATAAHLATCGFTRLHICTPDNNVEGRIFYERIGGVVVGEREDYEDGELIKLVVYEWPDIHSVVNLNTPRKNAQSKAHGN